MQTARSFKPSCCGAVWKQSRSHVFALSSSKQVGQDGFALLQRLCLTWAHCGVVASRRIFPRKHAFVGMETSDPAAGGTVQVLFSLLKILPFSWLFFLVFGLKGFVHSVGACFLEPWQVTASFNSLLTVFAAQWTWILLLHHHVAKDFQNLRTLLLLSCMHKVVLVFLSTSLQSWLKIGPERVNGQSTTAHFFHRSERHLRAHLASAKGCILIGSLLAEFWMYLCK